VSQKSGTTTELAARERDPVAVTRSNGVEQANWLSQLLARASRDDDSADPAPRLASDPEPLRSLESRMNSSEVGAPTQAGRRPAATSVGSKRAQGEAGMIAEDRKNVELPGAWPDTDGALDLVRKAAEALSLMEERATALESYALKVVKEAREELAAAATKVSSYRERALAAEEFARELQNRLAESQDRLSHSEERARHAEEEAENAKTWIAHVNDVITSTLSNAVRDVRDAPEGDLLESAASKIKKGGA
jgi:hypothetical protein